MVKGRATHGFADTSPTWGEEAMRQLIGWPLLVCLVLLTSTNEAQSADEGQYRAAVTRLFVWQYHALPLIRLNPVYPGDVITLKNETHYAQQKSCYPQLKVPNYRAIQSYQSMEALSLSGDLKVGGELLHKEIAEIEADVKAKFASTGYVRLNPLSIDAVDAVALKSGKFNDANCKVILDVLNKKPNGLALVQQVLHGRVGLVLTTLLDASLDAKAKGDALKRMAGAFKITEADISIAGQLATVTVSESPQPMSLAFVPYGYDAEEIARITHFLQGKRGTDLEMAVQQAITTGDVRWREAAKLWIAFILGSEEVERKESWAQRVVGGDPPEAVASAGLENADFRKVATYGAAMELLRQEAPERRR
jgi:hypothetical protein